MSGRDLVDLEDLDEGEIREILRMASGHDPPRATRTLEGKILGLAFFEPSTRTKASFTSAMLRLGGSVVDMGEPSTTSLAKGEGFSDTLRILSGYCDALVIRHKLDGAARYASELLDIPVVNAGDGSRAHPTQALLDLYTIGKIKGRLEGLSVGVLGDLKYGRAANSFILAISRFSPKVLYLISPPLLRPRREVLEALRRRTDFRIVENPRDVIGELDILYVTRIQRERFPDPEEYERVKNSYVVDLELLKEAREDLRILHPLPRVGEIRNEVDSTPFAAYFEQARNGVPVRMAVLEWVLGHGGA
ncbi:MAG: aspartate carbamoyltransferase [Thermoplasmata archaeon]|nr:aspartate carbamoyltransferase [Thermoplasmata archaeon]